VTIPPPETTTAVQMSPLRPATPVDNFVQGLQPNITQRQDNARALTSNIHAVNPQSADNCYGADISTSQPSYHSAGISTSQSPYNGANISTSQPLYNADSMSTSPPPFLTSAMGDRLSVCRTVVTSARARTPIPFPREQLPSNLGSQHVHTHTLPRRPGKGGV